VNPNAKRNEILEKLKEIETVKSKGLSLTSIL
jgi:hypothetical protein